MVGCCCISNERLPSIYDASICAATISMLRRRARRLTESKICLCNEEPSSFFSSVTQEYIENDRQKPGKRWVHDVVMHGKEREHEILRMPGFVVLPDHGGGSILGAGTPTRDKAIVPRTRVQDMCVLRDPVFDLHLLAIAIDPSLRCLRDLNGDHVALLEQLQEKCMEIVRTVFGVDNRHVLIFANYPPSVYQLHFHICAPFKRVSSYDAFRVHPLTTIISNLRLNGRYYNEVTFRVPVLTGSDLHMCITGDRFDQLCSEECTDSCKTNDGKRADSVGGKLVDLDSI